MRAPAVREIVQVTCSDTEEALVHLSMVSADDDMDYSVVIRYA
jgi:hypothetical protein